MRNNFQTSIILSIARDFLAQVECENFIVEKCDTKDERTMNAEREQKDWKKQTKSDSAQRLQTQTQPQAQQTDVQAADRWARDRIPAFGQVNRQRQAVPEMLEWCFKDLIAVGDSDGIPLQRAHLNHSVGNLMSVN